MTRIPGTKTDAVFHQVGTHTDQNGNLVNDYPPLYGGYGTTGIFLASMNAGNSDQLYVGGGGINAGFAHVLGATQDIDLYQKRHQEMADTAQTNSNTTKAFSKENPCASMSLCNFRVAGVGNYTGIAFLDAFSEARCPDGDGGNRAMLYVAPPLVPDYTDAKTLAADISAVGQHAIEAVATHNAWAAQNGAVSIEAVRLCAYSAGIYAGKLITKEDTGMAIFEGVVAGLKQTGLALKEVQMPLGNPSPCDPLFNAVKAYLDS